jgi:hypothetical protein
MVGAAVFFGASSAQAAFLVVLQSGASTQVINDGDFLDTAGDGSTIQIANLNFAGYNVSVTARTNSPGSVIPGLGLAGRVTDQTVSVQNTGANSSLTVTVYSDGFLLGTGPGTLSNAVSGTALDVNSPTNSSATSNSWINGSSTLPGVIVPNGTATGDVTIFGATVIGAGQTNEKAVVLTQPLSITNQLTISNLAVNGTANVTGTAIVTSAPAPGALVLALAAFPGLGLGAWIRRRKTVVVS